MTNFGGAATSAIDSLVIYVVLSIIAFATSFYGPASAVFSLIQVLWVWSDVEAADTALAAITVLSKQIASPALRIMLSSRCSSRLDSRSRAARRSRSGRALSRLRDSGGPNSRWKAIVASASNRTA